MHYLLNHPAFMNLAMRVLQHQSINCTECIETGMVLWRDSYCTVYNNKITIVFTSVVTTVYKNIQVVMV